MCVCIMQMLFSEPYPSSVLLVHQWMKKYVGTRLDVLLARTATDIPTSMHDVLIAYVWFVILCCHWQLMRGLYAVWEERRGLQGSKGT